MSDTAMAKIAARKLDGRTRRIVLSGIALTACVAIPALATQGAGFVGTTLSAAIMGPTISKADKVGAWDIEVKSRGRTLVGVDQIAVAANGQSGWHTHAGLVIISVKTGSLRWTDGDTCVTTLYNAGDSFIEPANHLHLVRNASAAQPAEFTGVQLRPEGSPGRIDAPAPSNNCGL